MEIIVIKPFRSATPHFQEMGYISDYKSLLWQVQWYGVGYFELVTSATTEHLNLLIEGRILCREVDKVGGNYNNAMVVRTVDLEWNPDEGYMLRVSGYQIKDVLNQRIIWNQYMPQTSAYSVFDIVNAIINMEVVDPVGNVNNILTGLTTQMEIAEQNRDNAYAAYQQAVIDHGADSQEARDAYALWKVYVVQCDELQKKINKQMENCTFQSGRQIRYVTIDNYSDQPPRIEEMQLHGEQIGDWITDLLSGYHCGWTAYLTDSTYNVKLMIGTDRSSTVVFSPEYDNLKNSLYEYTVVDYKNTAQVGGEGEGTEQIIVKVGDATGYTNFETYIDGSGVSENAGEVSRSRYKQMLIRYGQTELQQYSQRKHFSGEIDPDGMFKLGIHFFLGDVVMFQDGDINSKARLIEIMYADEESGTSTTATFEEVTT